MFKNIFYIIITLFLLAPSAQARKNKKFASTLDGIATDKQFKLACRRAKKHAVSQVKTVCRRGRGQGRFMFVGCTVLGKKKGKFTVKYPVKYSCVR